nr:hypothetical protein C5F59_14590 [Streptomyces sp. QL37]
MAVSVLGASDREVFNTFALSIDSTTVDAREERVVSVTSPTVPVHGGRTGSHRRRGGLSARRSAARSTARSGWIRVRIPEKSSRIVHLVCASQDLSFLS